MILAAALLLAPALSAILTPAVRPREPMTEPTSSLAKQLDSATRGLLFLSETDAPLVPFVNPPRPGSLAVAARRITGRTTRDRFHEVAFEDFFRPLTESHEWDGAEERTAIRRFKRLEKLLSEELTDIHVFKIGSVEIDVIVIGRSRPGEIAGFHTRALET